MINVSKLKEGIVIDHIRAGHGYKIFQQLGYGTLEDVVVLMRNVESTKMGHKDLIKIETNMVLNLDVLGLHRPGRDHYLRSGGRQRQEDQALAAGDRHRHSHCKNPRCISNQEHIKDIHFHLVDAKKNQYACEYCDARTSL
jgi:aspartate carbamoyltransferase regulatory subunit